MLFASMRENCEQSAAATERLLTKTEVARFFAVSIRTIETWMREGKLPFYKLGHTVRFRMADLLRNLQERHQINKEPISSLNL